MKNFILSMIFLLGIFLAAPVTSSGIAPPDQSTSVAATADQSPEAIATDTGDGTTIELPNSVEDDIGGKMRRNWGKIALGLLGVAEIAVRLTPSRKDNSILSLIVTIVNAVIPNIKKGGGTHKVPYN